MKSKRTHQRHLRELRQLIESTTDPVEMRVAYAMEQAVRWAIENTRGWPSLRQEAIDEAYILRKEMGWTDADARVRG